MEAERRDSGGDGTVQMKDSANVSRATGKTILTVFPLIGAQELVFNITALTLREKIPVNEDFAVYMNKWSKYLSRRLKTPVIPKSDPNNPEFYIQTESTQVPVESVDLTYEDNLTFHVAPSGISWQIKVKDATREQSELVCSILEKSISNRFKAIGSNFWEVSPSEFYDRVPRNQRNPRDQVNAFRGFNFKVIGIRGDLYLAFDMRTSYAGRKSLKSYSLEERARELSSHLDTRSKRRLRFLRDNGRDKYYCTYAGETGRTASEFYIEEINKTVYEYYHEKYPELGIRPGEPVVYVNRQTPVPSCVLYPVFGTGEVIVKRCSVKAQIGPYERLSQIQRVISKLGILRFGHSKIEISLSPLTVRAESYEPPSLVFGDGKVLFVGDNGLAAYNNQKIESLALHGPIVNRPMPPVVVLYPKSLSAANRDRFGDVVSEAILKFTHRKVALKYRHYESMNQADAISSIQHEFENAIQSDRDSIMFVCILWEGFDKSVHRTLKQMFNNYPSQLFKEKTAFDLIFSRARGKLENAVLAIITEAGIKPWGLEKHLSADITIGIDLLFGNIGYSFICGENAENTYIDFKRNTKKGRYKESMSKNNTKSIVKALLDEAHHRGFDISKVVIHRDGRWWPSESEGLREAVQEYETEHHVSLDYSVVEILKDHFPVRVLFKNSQVGGRVSNPAPGTFFQIAPDEAILVNSGSPGAWDRWDDKTARPLKVKIAESKGSISFSDLLRDIFQLSCLNWAAPRINLRLPVTIGWLDDALRGEWENEEEQED